MQSIQTITEQQSARYNALMNEAKSISKQYYEQITESALKERLVKDNGFGIIEDNRLNEFETKKAHLKNQIYIEYSGIMEKLRQKAAGYLDEFAAICEAYEVDLYTGKHIVNEYAKRHNITADQAKQTLSEYASMKRHGLDQNNIADRYAALVNHANLSSSPDKEFSQSILVDIANQLKGMKQAANGIRGLINDQSLLNISQSAGQTILDMMKQANQ